MKSQKRILIILLCCLLFTQVAIGTKEDLSVNKKGAEDVEQLLKEKINFINPIDAFTIYSFINYTGYDQENHTKFHPVREGVRKDLIAKDINISRPNYFNDFGGYSMLEADMTSFIGWIGSPPNFTIDPKMRNALGMYVNGDLGDLDKMLTEFYREADIQNLYKKYKPYYDDVINRNQNEVYSSLSKTVNHFNLDIGKMRDFDIFINLLDMNWRGYMIDSLNIDPNTTKPYLMQIGPTPNNDINIHNVVHEFAHIFEIPIIRSSPKEFKKLNMALVYEYGSPTNPDYQTWDKIVDESIVRAMTVWAMNGNRNDIIREVSEGFIMTEYIYNRISDFDNNPNLNFEGWLLSVMDDYANKIHDFEDVNNGDYDEGYEDGYSDGIKEGYKNGYDDGYEKGIKEESEVTNKDWLEFPSVEGVSLDKTWSINLNKSFNAIDIDSVSIVKDNLFIACDITLEPGDKKITVNPARPYERDTIYSLRIFLSNGNKYKMQFKTAN